MWNNPRLLNALANALLVLAFGLALALGGREIAGSPAFALRSIRVAGPLHSLERARVIEALQGRVSGTFFTVDLAAIREVFRGIPWVRRAEVRRVWPDRLEVTLEEHVALARWGQAGSPRLVNVYGELFDGATDEALPVFAGPDGSEGEIARRYAQVRGLFAPLGLAPQQLLLSSRRAWQVRLSNGLTLQLGRDSERDPIDGRLARFVEVFPHALAPLARRLEYVDLRYPNGFALRVPEIAAAPSSKPVRRNKA